MPRERRLRRTVRGGCSIITFDAIKPETPRRFLETMALQLAKRIDKGEVGYLPTIEIVLDEIAERSDHGVD